jgi:uncharacterized protein YjbI with pentapeptide repeats
MEVPDDRCGFELSKGVLERDRLPRDTKRWFVEMSSDDWYREYNLTCCCRPVWNHTSRCIWHADVEEKPVEDLIAAQAAEEDSIDFSGISLRNLELNDSISFKNCRLIGADLSGSHLERANFQGANLLGGDLSDTMLWYADFSESLLWAADFSDAKLGMGNLSDTHLGDANLTGTNLVSVNLSGAYLEEVDLSGRPLWGANLSRAELEGANLSGADLRDTDLSGADLTRVDLYRAILQDADLSGGILEAANLSEAYLWGTVLHGADLWEADLSGADVRDAELRGARFQETILADIRLNQNSRLGEPDVRSLIEASDAENGLSLVEIHDSLARGYHLLGEAAKENGLVGKARRLRIWERRARRREARANGDWGLWFGSLFSEYAMGYGISLKRISVAILFVIFTFAGAYWLIRIPSAGTLAEALDYSVTTFTGIGSNTGPPISQPARSLAIIESFVGVLFAVLLGYVLGTRESP